jgi:hypothetical protein
VHLQRSSACLIRPLCMCEAPVAAAAHTGYMWLG